MKNKKILIIVIITLVLLVILGGGVIATLYFATDIFKSNDELFWKYFLQNEKISSIVSNENYATQQQCKTQNSYTSNGQLIISSQSAENNKQEMNFVTTSRHDINTGRTYADISLVKNNNNILKASYINSGDVYSVMCEDICKYYIGFRNNNLQELAKKWGVPEEQIESIPNSIDFSSNNNSLELTDAEKQHIYNMYSNVILQSISKDDYKKMGKETVTVNNTEHEADKYELTLSGEKLKQILINCLTTLQTDTDTINSIMSKLNVEDTETFTNGILTNIDEIISNIQETTVEENLTITVYVENSKTIRTQVEMTNLAKITIDLTTNEVSFLIENYNNNLQNELYENTEKKEPMKFVFTKVGEQEIVNTLTITPNINEPEQNFLLSMSLGNVQNNSISNSYSLTINSNNSVTELTYDTQITSSAQVEEIMELSNSNSVIINNYSLEQLSKFFSNIGQNAAQVLPNKLQDLQPEISAFGEMISKSINDFSYNEQESIMDY